jgi:1-deoxyxylulose-5-phosphate synthase
MRSGRIAGVKPEVSRLIQGTRLLGEHREEQAFALFDAVYESGCNAFDTAPVYRRGGGQEMLGRWMAARGLRSSIVIFDKGCHPAGGVARMNPAELEQDVSRALERFATDYIDVYLLHRDDPSVPVDEIMSALNEQRVRGRIRAFGGSNWTHQRLQQAEEYAKAHGFSGFAASSPELNLLTPVSSWPGCISVSHDPDALAWYRATNMPLLAWSPFASGFLTGRFARDDAPEALSPEARRSLEFYGSDANWLRVERLRALAERRSVSLAEAALAWVFHVNADVYAVVGCREPAEFQSSLRALELRFSDSELLELEVSTGA